MNSFKEIMAGELKLAPNMKNQYSSFSLKRIIGQLQDIISASITKCPFGQNYCYDPLNKKATPITETVIAHTALTTTLFEKALLDCYGADFGEPNAKHTKTDDGYSYREAMEAAKVYSLSELKASDEGEKKLFLSRYIGYHDRGIEFAQHVLKLASGETTTDTAKALLLADRTATIFMALARDRINEPSLLQRSDGRLNADEKQILMQLPAYVGNSVKVSQLLLYKFFKTEELTKIDDTGLFTAIIITQTLNANGTWPSWRLEDYM